jgi:hypothetical protein
MKRSILIKTDCNCSMPGIVRALDQENFDKAAAAQISKGRKRPVLTAVGKYISRKEGKLTKRINKILRKNARELARKAAAAYSKRMYGKLQKYREDQPRDYHGRWTDSSGSLDAEIAANDNANTPNAYSLDMRSDDFEQRFLKDGGTESRAEHMAERVDDLIYEAGGHNTGTALGDDAAAKTAVMEHLSAALIDKPEWDKLMHATYTVIPDSLREGISQQLASNVVHEWAKTSSDSSSLSLLMQDLAAQEFGLSWTVADSKVDSRGTFQGKGADFLADRVNRLMFNGILSNEDVKTGLRTFLREMYDQTQADLKANGVKELFVSRGVAQELARGYDEIKMNPISSWSADEKTAYAFAEAGGARTNVSSTMLFTRIPASRVLSTPRTGYGCRGEREVVVLGGPTSAVKMSSADYYNSPNNWSQSVADILKQHEDKLGKAAPFNVDADLDNADWLKTTWDLPPYKSPEFMRVVHDLDAFRKLPVYRHAVRAGLIVNDQWAVKKLAKAANDGLVEEVLQMLREQGMPEEMVDELRDEVIDAYKTAGRAGIAQVGIDASEAMVHQLDVEAAFWAANRGGELMKDFANTTDEAVREVLNQAVEEGWSADDLQSAIEDLGAFGEVRASMIARTELAFAHVQGSLEGWRSTGEVEGKRSILGDLHEVADECDDAAEMGVVDIDDDFGGLGDPPFHPNCFCDLLPVLRAAPELEDDSVEE